MVISEIGGHIDEERDKFKEIQKRDIYWFKEKYNFKDYGVL